MSIKMSVFDENQNFFKRNKFEKKWETNVMAKNLIKKNIPFSKYKFFQTEYI
jgi:hypothetical protein